ncbi:MAG: pilus assembly protein [Propionibacteriaceae bacterium]|jgi:Flp pilus assembly protein TadG|nr:pilus assembly protein [Propionibacteriaceae bacterium]
MRALRSRSPERGAAALEFALVAPVLILMIMGMVDFGMVVNAQAVVANGARDGARVASLNGSEANARAAALKSASSLGGAAPTVSVQCFTDITATTPCTGANYDVAKAAGNIVRVTVTYTYTWITPLPTWIGRGPTQTISKVSFMRIEST